MKIYNGMPSLEDFHSIIEAQKILGQCVYPEPSGGEHIMGVDYVPIFQMEETKDVLQAINIIAEVYGISSCLIKPFLNEYINTDCELYGVRSTIHSLICCGATKQDLIEMSFDEDDIDCVFEYINNEVEE